MNSPFGPMENGILWGIEPWRLVVAILIIFLGLLSKSFVTSVFRFLGRRGKDNAIKWDDEAAALLPKPVGFVIQVLLWRVAASVLMLPREPVDTAMLVQKGLDMAVTVGAVWVLFRIVDVIARVADRFADTTQTKIDDQAVPLLRKTLKVVLALVAGIFIVQNFGYSVTSVIAGLGIGGLALALAAQDSVANFFGSVVLFTDAPFQVGDYVEVEGVSGTVEEVGFRTTRIRQIDSSIACVPNKTFTSSFITNYTARKGRALELDLGLSMNTPADKIETFLRWTREIMSEQPNIVSESIEVNLASLEKSVAGVRIKAFTIANSWEEFLHTRESLILKIMRALEELELTLAKMPVK